MSRKNLTVDAPKSGYPHCTTSTIARELHTCLTFSDSVRLGDLFSVSIIRFAKRVPHSGPISNLRFCRSSSILRVRQKKSGDGGIGRRRYHLQETPALKLQPTVRHRLVDCRLVIRWVLSASLLCPRRPSTVHNLVSCCYRIISLCR